MKRLLWPLIVAMSVGWCASVVLAANTGKISGKITDAATNEPIPGVAVQIVNTTAGAASDANGDYFILNVPVGEYSLRVSALGYETQNITGVQILADQTRTVNIPLKQSVIQGEEVTVEAQRDVIHRDVSTTVRSVTSNEITQLPITTYRDALSREAGVVGERNNIHIRGGRPNEVLYLVDGMPVRDPQFDVRSLDVSDQAIGEMQVLTAGFNAEYGDAQSAVVNLVIKEGEPVYHGHLQQVNDVPQLSGSHTIPQSYDPITKAVIYDPANPPGHKISNYEAYAYTEGSLSGPEPITQELLPRLGVKIPGSMSFFASGTGWGTNSDVNGVYENTDSWFRHPLWDVGGLTLRRNQSYVNSNIKLTYAPDPKSKINLLWNQDENWVNPYIFRDSRRFPQDFTQEQITTGMHALATIQGLRTDATSFPQRFGVDDDGDGRIDEEALNWVDDDGDGLIDEDLQPYSFNANNAVRTDHSRDQQFAVTLNHSISQKTYYTLHVSAYDVQRTLAGQNKPPSQYGEASEPYTDLPDSLGQKNGHYDVGEPFTDLNGNHMWDYGNPINAYPAINGFIIGGTGLAGNIQQLVPDWAQFTSRVYTFKGDMSSQMTQRHLVKGGVEYNYYNTATTDLPYPEIATNGGGIYTDIYRYYPSAAAAYLQDKAEFKDIIINAGLRGDYWIIPGDFLQHPYYGQPNRNSFIDYVPPKKGGEFYLSPRLGIAYSVTEKDVFHFNYGYFYQRAPEDFYFTGVNQSQTGGTPVLGNPSLKPQRTIAYELGVRHQFGTDFLLDVSTYYKDITNWVNTASENELFYDLYHQIIVGSNAAIYYNQDYASSRGFEFNISKQYGSHFAGRMTYTLAWATGSNSYDIGSNVTRSNYAPPPRETPLAWDRRHQLVLNLSYDQPLAGRPFTQKWLESGWNINVISQALSGLPYTPTYGNGSDVTGQEFTKNSPWIFQTDLNLSRAFKIASLDWRLLLQVRNLFDNVNVLGWDVNPYSIDTYLNGMPGYVNDTSSPNFGQNPKSSPNPDAWGERRSIRVGLAVEF